MDLDTSNPAVQDFLALVRLQVLTPLSLLLNIATVVVCATITTPTIPHIAYIHPTAISPEFNFIAVYVLAVYVGQIGYCVLLVLASKPETKHTLTKAVGLSLVFANFIMGLWAIAWVLQWFLITTILQGLLLLLLLYSNIALLVYHPPTFARPFDMALIHAPLRFFLLLPLAILFPYCLFITLHLGFHPPEPGNPPVHYSAWHAWSGFAVVMSTNLLALLVIIVRRDIVWCVAATWLCISLWLETPKPAPVYIPTIVFTVLHPLALFLSLIYVQIYGNQTRGREGHVALRGEDDALHHNPDGHQQQNGEREEGNENRDANGNDGTQRHGAREVDVEALWG